MRGRREKILGLMLAGFVIAYNAPSIAHASENTIKVTTVPMMQEEQREEVKIAAETPTMQSESIEGLEVRDGKITSYTGSKAILDLSGRTDINGISSISSKTLVEIILPATVTSIDANAFSSCENLTSVILPENGLLTIGADAFKRCVSLTGFTIPSTVRTIGSSAFFRCNALESVTFLGEEVKSLASDTFSGCDVLRSIELPDTITTIENGAFEYCSALADVKLPANLESIGRSAFSRTALTSVTIPEGCRNIGDYAFTFTLIKEVSIPSACETIGNSAFSSCGNLKKVIFPDGEEGSISVGEQAFSSCTNLKEVINGKRITEFSERIFAYSTALDSIDISKSCTAIGEMAFFATNLSEVMIPKTCKLVAASAFEDVKSLKNVVIEERESSLVLGESCFKNCENLTKIVLPEGVSAISDSAFSGCDSLEEIMLPESCKTIGVGAFELCKSLAPKLIIPAGCTTISSSAFWNCTSLKQVKFYNPNTSLASRAFATNGEDVVFYAEPGGTVQTYADSTANSNIRFNRYSDAIAVTSLPNKREYFYGEKFSTDGLVITADFTSETAPATSTVPVPECSISGFNSKQAGKQSIAVEYGGAKTAFDINVYYDLSKASVNYVSNWTYTGNVIEPEVKVTGKETSTGLIKNVDYTVSYSENHTDVGTYTITIQGIGNYRGIQQKTFKINPKEISENDIKISVPAQEYTGAVLTPDATVIYNGKTFMNGVDYTISYNNNKNIGMANAVVKGMKNFSGTVEKTFTVNVKPGKVYSSGKYNYKVVNQKQVALESMKNKNTKKVVIPATVTIGGKKFKVTSILAKAFEKNTKITSVVIGDEITSIGDAAWKGCSKLKTVTIGKKVAKIEKSAFENCKNLNKITIQSTKLKSVGKNALKGIKKNAKIKVPSQKVSKYKKLFKGKGQSKDVKITK